MSFRKAMVRICFGSVFLGMMVFLVQCSQKECYYDTECGGQKVCKDNVCRNLLVTPDMCSSNTDCKVKGQQCIKGRCIGLPTDYEFPEKFGPEPGPEPKAEPGPEPPGPEPDAGPEPEPEKGPTTCTNNLDCSALPDHVCAYSDAIGGLLCQPVNKGGKKFKEPCNPAAAAPGDCASRTCHPTRKVCTTICSKVQNCVSGVCESVKIGQGTFGVCLASDNECNRDKDCGTGNNNNNLCVLQQQGASRLVTRCRTAVGQRDPGLSCFGDGDCKHNYCVGRDFCGKFCVDNTDCATGFQCEVEEITRFGLKFKFKVCKYPKEGLPCTTDKQCQRTGYICVPAKAGTKLELRCQNPSGAEYTQDCKTNADCRSNTCLTNSGLKCSKPCTANSECSRAGGDAKCANVLTTVGGVKQTLKMCVLLFKACTKNADCKDIMGVCSPHTDDSGAFSMRCLDSNPTAKILGADCSSNDDCKSRICYKNRCSSLCTSASECGSSKQGFQCTAEKIQFTGKPDINVTLCTVPSTGLSCNGQKNKTEPQCPSKVNNTCRILEQGAKLESRCRPKVLTATKKIGDLCTKDSECDTGSCLLPDGVCTHPCSAIAECTNTGRRPLRCLIPNAESSVNGKKSIGFPICSYKHCSGDPDCDKGQVCRYLKNATKGFWGCVTPDPKEKLAGAVCKANADCRSNLCHPTKKICSPPCKGGKDATCPLQFACELQANGPDQTHLCLPLPSGCLHDGACKSGEMCVFSLDSSGRPRQTCGAALASRKLGEFCDPKAQTPQCQTGFCDPKTLRCSQFCSLASHCPKGSYRCTTVTISTGTGASKKSYDLQACRSVLCRYNLDCQSGEVCKVSLVGLVAVNKCAPALKTLKKVGESCSLDNDCQTGLCGKSGGSSVCLALCSAHRHCTDSAECGNTTFITTTVKACLRGKRKSCSGDRDCATGEVCQVNFVGGKPVATCIVKRLQDLASGKACDPLDGFPGKCASHLCDPVTKKCLSVCAPGLSDCSSTEVCDNFNILNKPINACIPPPSVCTKSKDCTAGTVCGATLIQTSVRYSCLRTVIGRPKKVGEACLPSAPFPGNCQTSLCHPGLQICVNTCKTDKDCTDSKRPLCGKIPLPNGILARACVPKGNSCNRDAECPATEPVCGLELSNNKLSRKCSRGSTFGSKKIGESCNPQLSISKSECSNRFCEIGREVCTAVCTDNSHCPTGTVCGQTLVDGIRKLRGCIPPVGSRCKRAKACALPSVCRAQLETSSVIAKCRVASGSARGAVCTPTGKISLECQSGVCHPDSKRCAFVCEKDADCVLGRCKEITLEGFKVKACNVACQKDSECPTGQLCGSVIVGQKRVTTCIKPDIKKKAIGATCDPLKQLVNSDCQTSFCGPVNSKCTSVCALDSDCPSGQICATTFVRLNLNNRTPARACVPAAGSCLSPDHCNQQQICQLETRSGKVNTNCKAPDLKRKAAGNACTSTGLPGDCRTGLCDPKSKECTTTCTKDSQCTKGPRTKCATITVGGASVAACVKP